MPDHEIDGAKFSQLVLETERRMRSLVLAMVPGCRDVDDIVQEACAAMWRKLDEYDVGRSFAPWALAFVRMQVLAYLKSKKRDRVQLSAESMDTIYVAMSEATLERQDDEEMSALEDCLASLTAGERQMLTQRFVEQRSVTEISGQKSVNQSCEALYKFFSRLQIRLLDCINRKLSS